MFSKSACKNLTSYQEAMERRCRKAESGDKNDEKQCQYAKEDLKLLQTQCRNVPRNEAITEKRFKP